MKRAAIQTAVAVHDYRSNISLVILFGCFMLAAMYAVNLYGLVSRTIAIRSAESQASSMANDVSSLDAQYLKLASEITPDALQSHGLSQGKVSLYISEPVPTASRALAAGQL